MRRTLPLAICILTALSLPAGAQNNDCRFEASSAAGWPAGTHDIKLEGEWGGGFHDLGTLPSSDGSISGTLPVKANLYEAASVRASIDIEGKHWESTAQAPFQFDPCVVQMAPLQVTGTVPWLEVRLPAGAITSDAISASVAFHGVTSSDYACTAIWYVNGAEVHRETSCSPAPLGAAHHQRGDHVRLDVYANGPNSLSGQATTIIANAAPVATITKTECSGRTCFARAVFSDADGDPVSARYEWYANDTLGLAAPVRTGPSLDLEGAILEHWPYQVVVWADDGSDASMAVADVDPATEVKLQNARLSWNIETVPRESPVGSGQFVFEHFLTFRDLDSDGFLDWTYDGGHGDYAWIIQDNGTVTVLAQVPEGPFQLSIPLDGKPAARFAIVWSWLNYTSDQVASLTESQGVSEGTPLVDETGFPECLGAADNDGDGICDVVETMLGTDPQNGDEDGDGALDGQWAIDLANETPNEETTSAPGDKANIKDIPATLPWIAIALVGVVVRRRVTLE